MIENKLVFHELRRMLRPILRLDPMDVALAEIGEVLSIPVADPDDVVCQRKLLVTYRGFRIDITDLRWLPDCGPSIHMQFKTPQRWWHGLIGNQNRPIV
jgi:hypothetical protein